MEKEAREQLAVEYNQSRNCCQSVLLACRDLTGMDEETAISLGYCFAGGMLCGEVCGAVTGGLMALGSSLPGDHPAQQKPAAVAMGTELQRRFRQVHGTTICREILRANGKKICDDCVACSAGIVHDIVTDLRKEEQQ